MNFCDFYLFLKSNDTLVAMTLQSLVMGILLFQFQLRCEPGFTFGFRIAVEAKCIQTLWITRMIKKIGSKFLKKLEEIGKAAR
jgi:hypothetical protein